MPWWPPKDSAQWHSAPICSFYIELRYMEIPKNKIKKKKKTDSYHYCFEFKNTSPHLSSTVVSPSPHRCQGTLPISQIDHAFVAHLPRGLEGQCWGYINLMKRLNMPQHALERVWEIVELYWTSEIMAVNDIKKQSALKFQVAEWLS